MSKARIRRERGNALSEEEMTTLLANIARTRAEEAARKAREEASKSVEQREFENQLVHNLYTIEENENEADIELPENSAITFSNNTYHNSVQAVASSAVVGIDQSLVVQGISNSDKIS